MTPNDIDILREADRQFDRLLDLPDDRRDAALDTLTDNADLRQQLRRLLDAHRRAGLLDRAGRAAGTPPERVGDWRLGAEIGRGGMAVVYRAERDMPDGIQVAAVKLLTVGVLSVRGHERLLREQAILARLDHPNIAALVDAGVLIDGTPWLAMTFVDGQRVDDWCDQRHSGPREIVALILEVCAAVDHAHRNLVIHRDLKPSNILVDRSERVRLLDFGIARLLEEGAADDDTITLAGAMTPRYAAPEQLQGSHVTTATDVFGLGAVLYRLLVGRPPRDGARLDEAVTLPSRAVGDGAGAAWSSRRRRELRGDLDTIVMKALAPDPGRRYASVQALANDLRAWIERRPITARPASFAYRASRFVARHRVGTALGLCALAFAAIAFREVVVARNEADLQAERAVAVRDFLANVFLSVEPSKGRIPDAVALLEQGSQDARALPHGEVAADILTITGNAFITLSAFAQAERDLTAARDILIQLRPAPARELSNVYEALGIVAKQQGRPQESARSLREALVWVDRWESPPEYRIRLQVSLASNTAYAGQPEQAEATLRRLLDDIRHSGLANTHLHLDALNALGTALALQKRGYDEMISLHEQRLTVARALYGEGSGIYAYTLADAVPTMRRAGRVERAEALAREAVEITDRVYSSPHMYVAVAHCNRAAVLRQQGNHAMAIDGYSRAIAVDEALAREDLHAASCRIGRAYSRAAAGDIDGARADLAADRRMLVHLGKTDTTYGLDNCGLEASMLLRQGRPSEANKRIQSCAPAEATAAQSRSDWLDLARVESSIHRGDWRAAAERLTALRVRNQPVPYARDWLRPWMLSVLVARELGDTASATDFVAAVEAVQPAPSMQDFAIASPCLEAPTLHDCLVLP